jgi:hypothetical protein
LIIIFFISDLPFVTLPYTLSIAVSMQQSSFISALPFPVVLPPLPPQFDFQLLLILNIVSCLMVIIGSAIKGVKEYKLTPLYSLLTLLQFF